MSSATKLTPFTTLLPIDDDSGQHTTKTTCAYCGVGCGLSITSSSDRGDIQLTGDREHPANYGRLCSKGSALAETLSLDSRLLHPQVDGQQVSWPKAIDAVANGFQKVIEQYGPDAVALYVSGQLLTEDYYVANKLMKGFIGSGNIDTNSRLCMSSSVAGHKRAFGSDTVPNCYDDLDHTDLIILIGANSAWCHPVLFQQMQRAKEANPQLKVVVIDPRKNNTCDIADLHLALNSGTDVALFNGLLAYLAKHQKLDHDYIEQYTNNFSAALDSANTLSESIDDVAQTCGLTSKDLEQFYQWFADTPKTMSLYSQGVNQSSSGTDKVNAIINCHLATGRIGKLGSGPLSLTGQPNAMGGREVGGLANQLAAHLEFDEKGIQIARTFWDSDTVADQPGLTAVDMFDAVADGKIKAIWVMATNPVSSLPNADKVKQALQQCDLVVVSDCVANTDTLDLANISLPAAGWSEKDGTVTNSERRISRQRAFQAYAGEAKPDWWIVSEVAKAMGFGKAFNYNSAADIFREHARFSGFENHQDGKLRSFNIEGLANVNDQEYDSLAPVQWPVAKNQQTGQARLFAQGDFFTTNRKANFIAISAKQAKNRPCDDYPLILNTGRIRDQWHTMTRTGLAPRLNLHKPEPFIEIHPSDLVKYRLKQGELAVMRSEWGAMLGRIEESKAIKPGMIFAPMHWTNQLSAKGRVGALVNPVVDPISGQPESKHTPVRVSGFDVKWQGFVLSRQPLDLSKLNYRVDILGAGVRRYEIADQAMSLAELSNLVQEQFSTSGSLSWQSYEDPAMHVMRLACFQGDELQCVVMAQKDATTLPERTWLSSLFSSEYEAEEIRPNLLSGLPPVGVANTGKQICACFNVGELTIRDCITDQKLSSTAAIGQACKAGTNCGACLPELKTILQEELKASS